MSYIYKILNKVNGKFYIGSTNNYKRRWMAHRWKLRNNRHENLHLQSAWDKYGEINFKFSIIEKCEENKQFEREQYYIDLFKPFSPKGYNICQKAGIGMMCETEYKEREFNGENHPLATISNEEVIHIKKLLSEGVKQKYIVDNLDYSWGIIGKIATLNRWKEVGEEYNNKILSHKRKKWDNSMMSKIIKLKEKENKSWTEIGDLLNFSPSSLKKRYDKYKGKYKNCEICGKEIKVNSNSQKYCKECANLKKNNKIA